MSTISGLISGGGGGGIAPNRYTLDTLPMYVIDRNRVTNPNVGRADNTGFFVGDQYSRSLGDCVSGFVGTKGTGWSTVYNHTGSGTFVWFLSTSIGNVNGQIIVRLTVDGKIRTFDVTGNNAWSDRASVFVGTSTPWYGTNVTSEYVYTINNGTLSGSFNSTFTQSTFDQLAYFNPSGALQSQRPLLVYETDFKIEVYNSNSTGGSAGNYYGGMVIQGY